MTVFLGTVGRFTITAHDTGLYYYGCQTWKDYIKIYCEPGKYAAHDYGDVIRALEKFEPTLLQKIGWIHPGSNIYVVVVGLSAETVLAALSTVKESKPQKGCLKKFARQ